jgi:putative ABC transport system permease protein
MSLSRNLKLSLRMLGRDWRAGELHLFAIALVIAVGAVTAVGFFNDRVQSGLIHRSAELLGADLVLQSSEPFAGAWIEGATGRGLDTAATIDFTSVAVHGERLQLAAVRAVGAGFPLRGAVRTAPALYQPDANASGIPAVGSAWVEARLMHALALKIGDRIEIGTAAFSIDQVLTYEPGRSGNFFAFAPRVLINAGDVPNTGVIQPGSRVSYSLGLAGAADALRSYRDWLAPQLGPSQRFLGPREGSTGVARAVERVDRYIGLTSLLAVVLAGVAIAMAARRYSARHYDMSAMLRCLGCSQRDILFIYLPQPLALGVLASAAGCALGFAVQELIYYLVRGMFPVRLPAPGPLPAVFGMLAGLLVLAGFGIAPVLRLKSVPPLRVLRRELAPLPPSAWLVAGLAATAILLLMWRYTGSWTLTLSVLAGAVGAAGVLGALAWALLSFSRRLRPRVGVAWRFGLNNLMRRARASVGQILAFGFTLMAMAVIALVRTDLLTTWNTQLPAATPNHFAFNVLPAEVPALERFFATHAIPAQALYPMVRGRLTEINGAPVQQAVTKEEGDNDAALQRDLNLTWSEAVPPDNRLVRGAWWSAAARADDGTRVSIEERLAERLGIGLGDRLVFSIAGAALDARVTSIRKVQWDSFHPNFFMIFEPGTLADFPATYITSFYLTESQKPLLVTLLRQFPATTVLELDQFLEQVRGIVAQATLAVELVLLFVLAAGFAVLYAALATSLDERFYEGALLRTFGASRLQLRSAQLAEFVALGVCAGVLAAIGTELIAYFVYTRVFELEYALKWPVWLVAPLVGGALIGAAGYVGTRRVVERSPLAVLREV